MPGYEDNNHQVLKWGAAVLSVVICGGLFWYAMQERNAREIMTEHADPEPYKVRPEDPGGMYVPHQDKRIFGEAVGRPEHPEESLGDDKEQPVDAAVLSAPSPEPVVAPAVEPAPPAPKPEPTPKVVVEPTPEPEPVKRSNPVNVRKEPLPTQAEPTQAESTQAEPTQVEPQAEAIAGWGVQLGAFSTERGAEQAWSIFRKEHKDVLGALSSRIKAPGSNQKLYRLRAGRYDNEAAARAACASLKQAGQGCIPVWPY
jgi:cell division protein FtsN